MKKRLGGFVGQAMWVYLAPFFWARADIGSGTCDGHVQPVYSN
jgi:hypothetical protein